MKMSSRPKARRLVIPTLIMLLASLVVSGGLTGSAQAGAKLSVPGAPSTSSGSSTSPGATQRPEVLVVHLYFHDNAERDRLATEWGADEESTQGGYLTVWTDRPTYNRMLAAGLRAEVDQDTTRQANNPNLFGQQSPDTFYGGYKTVEDMQIFLDQEVAAHPTLAVKVDIGDSWCKTHPGACTQPAPTWNGYDLYVLQITNQAIPGPKPVFWYDTGIHSREIATPELAMRFISLLLDQYDSNPDSHWLVDWHDIWIMPMFNPDGHHMVEAGGNSPYYQRKNGDRDDGCTIWPPSGGQLGTDLNRNYPFKWNCCGGSSGDPCSEVYHGPSQDSEEETQAATNYIRTLIPDQRGPNDPDPAPITTTGILQNMHSSAQLDLYPWGWTGSPAPNGPDLGNVARHTSATNAYPPGNGYQACQPPNCLYAVDGDAVDWSYGELGIASGTTEIGGGGFFPAYSTIDSSLWPQNRGALVYQAKIARTPYLLAHGPDAKDVVSTPMTVTQGSPSQLTATINYAWSGNSFSQNVGAAEYYIDTPPWAGGVAIPMSGTFTSPTVPVNATVGTTSLSIGRHILFVRGRGANDYSGFQTWGPVSATFLDVTSPNPPGTPTTTATSTPLIPTATPILPTSTSIVPTGTPVPPTDTPGIPTETSTPVAGTQTQTQTQTPAPISTSTPCVITFTDVPATNPFYTYIRCLACRGIVSGYDDHTFRPFNNVNRGQMAKIVSNSAGYNEPIPSGQQSFEDVAPNSTYWVWVERLHNHGAVSGYTCGSPPAGPCVPPANLPYYLPYNSITRGQISKIVTVAAGYIEPIAVQSFQDVPPSDPFYQYIGRLSSRGIISGYDCGQAPAGPCVPPANLPYFLTYNDVTRGQAAKIAANTFYPNCQSPSRR